MNELPEYKEIFYSLKTNNNTAEEIAKVNLFQLTSHIEELYVRIADLERKLEEV
jgi:hypothetical protein